MGGWEDWANISSEILALVIKKVQERAAEDNDEMRRVVAMAGVCRNWRLAILSHLDANPFSSTGLLQFPCSIREAGPLDKPMQCVMRRKGGQFFLYQSDCGSGQEFPESDCNFLMGACKRWRPGHMMFVVSAERKNFSHTSSGFMGKLRSNFWGTAFVLWDYDNSKKARPVTFVKFTEENVDGMRKRKMTCVVRALRFGGLSWSSVSQHGMKACFSPVATKDFWKWNCVASLHKSIRSVAYKPRGYESLREEISKTMKEESARVPVVESSNEDHSQRKLKLRGVPGVLKRGQKVAMFTGKIPEWDVQRRDWSLDFKGRATLPSMHNFQLLLPEDKKRALENGREDLSSDCQQQNVVMQLGKIGKGLYALEFRYPLSAFQAFNIAVSSFTTTVGAEP